MNAMPSFSFFLLKKQQQQLKWDSMNSQKLELSILLKIPLEKQLRLNFVLLNLKLPRMLEKLNFVLLNFIKLPRMLERPLRHKNFGSGVG